MARVAFASDLAGIKDLDRLLSLYSIKPGVSSIFTFKNKFALIRGQGYTYIYNLQCRITYYDFR